MVLAINTDIIRDDVGVDSGPADDGCLSAVTVQRCVHSTLYFAVLTAHHSSLTNVLNVVLCVSLVCCQCLLVVNSL